MSIYTSKRFELGDIETTITAGTLAPAGSYVEIETGRLIVLTRADVLPASLDGRVAVYAPKSPAWSELSEHAYLSDNELS
ncbi:hypothetical protein CCAX7_61490 [Capsulimonas corticalis]|uniref:Uncharacterized protein n=1 Tax=Capsulimonas corticalis TaxID=2219043 RepID=A0A402CWE5_9BACT|nr:hypothetical protein [Capsulimonas corticalis]BDI34098.1 hypothetical protein CCAX7_61490 [Capsulimonas corticalis]